MTVEQLAAYELIEKQQIPEMNSVGYLLRHKKTGARVALLSNDDENKVDVMAHRHQTVRVYRILWSIPFSAAPRIFR